MPSRWRDVEMHMQFLRGDLWAGRDVQEVVRQEQRRWGSHRGSSPGPRDGGGVRRRGRARGVFSLHGFLYSFGLASGAGLPFAAAVRVVTLLGLLEVAVVAAMVVDHVDGRRH